jgi:hypothetical protein
MIAEIHYFFGSKAGREFSQTRSFLKRALVCGAGGFIGGHLVKKLKHTGYWVRGVDIKEHEYCPSTADEFLLLDLRRQQDCQVALTIPRLDEVYQLAADMGGMGFTHSAECAQHTTKPLRGMSERKRLWPPAAFLSLFQ